MRGEGTILGIIVVLLVVLSIFAQSGGGSYTFSSDIEVVGVEELEVKVDYTLSASRYSKSAHIVAFSTNESREDPIYIFFDHPWINGSFYPRVSGLYDHMTAKLRIYGYDGSISMVDRNELDVIFEGPNATLILASQPINDTSIAQAALEWVSNGGTIIGIGNKSVPFIYDPRYEVGGADYLPLRFEPLDFMDGEGMTHSPMAEAFAFQAVAPTKGIFVDDILFSGGEMVGYTYNRNETLTSAGLFNIGLGRLLIMSGDMFFPVETSGEEAYANDLSKIIASGVLWMTETLFLKKVDAGTESVEGILMATLPSARYVVVVAFNIDDFQDVFFRSSVEVGITQTS